MSCLLRFDSFACRRLFAIVYNTPRAPPAGPSAACPTGPTPAPAAAADPPPKVPPAAARRSVPRDRTTAPSPPEDLAAEGEAVAEGRSGREGLGLGGEGVRSGSITIW
jgi:hypothetical protein